MYGNIIKASQIMDKLVFNENNIPVFQFVPYRVLHTENEPVTEIAA
jgi:hypothetical protein